MKESSVPAQPTRVIITTTTKLLYAIKTNNEYLSMLCSTRGDEFFSTSSQCCTADKLCSGAKSSLHLLQESRAVHLTGYGIVCYEALSYSPVNTNHFSVYF